jgi:hypothetical protein
MPASWWRRPGLSGKSSFPNGWTKVFRPQPPGFGKYQFEREWRQFEKAKPFQGYLPLYAHIRGVLCRVGDVC